MARRHRRRRAAQAAGYVDDHLEVVWRYVAGMLLEPERARAVSGAVLGDLDPALLAESDRAELRRLVLTRARRAVRDELADGAEAAAPEGPAPHWLREGFVALDADEREAVLLLDVLALTPGEAAVVCDVDEAGLQDRRHRGHGRLVERLVGPLQ